MDTPRDPRQQFERDGFIVLRGFCSPAECDGMVSAMNAELKLDSEDEQKEAPSDASLEPLIERFKKVLEEHVSEVRLSDRLTDSPACLVLPDGGLQPYIERLLRAQQALDAPATKRILEINGDHPLIAHLRTLHTSNAEDSSVG